MATKVIQVTLDTAANPAVKLEFAGASGRAVQAAAGDTIKWQRQGPINFNIKDLQPTGTDEAFSDFSTGGSGQWLETTYQPTNLNPFAAFPYTLEVETEDNTTYDTTKENADADAASTDADAASTFDTTKRDAAPVDDRPVIRN